jgi:hypothetical protein
MDTGGWIIMLVSTGTVTALFGWCIWKLLSVPEQQTPHVHGFEFETPDEKAAREQRD